MKEGEQFSELLRKIVGHGAGALAAKSVGFELAAAGRAADAEVDSSGIERFQRAEDLGHFE